MEQRWQDEESAMEERRQHRRYPTFELVEVALKGSDGTEETIDLMLRDRSTGGIGGVYIGQHELGPETTYHLREPGQDDRRMRLAWRKSVAKYVSIVGFELVS